MKQLIKKYAFKAALVAGLLTLSAGGMMLSARLTKAHDPDAVQTVGTAAAPVVVLDAGHGKSTETGSETVIRAHRGAAAEQDADKWIYVNE